MGYPTYCLCSGLGNEQLLPKRAQSTVAVNTTRVVVGEDVGTTCPPHWIRQIYIPYRSDIPYRSKVIGDFLV